MRKIPFFTTLLGVFMLLSGCSLLATPSVAPIPTRALPAATATLELAFPTVVPSPTMALPTLAPTPSMTPTPLPVTPISATVVFDNFSLRSGPGRLFERVALYDSGSPVWVLARSQAADWVMVQTDDHRSGWMYTAGLEHLGDFTSLPVYQQPGAMLLAGHVWNVDHSPAAGIGVRINPAGSSDPSQMEDVTTGSDGKWTAYLPENSIGEWEVQLVSYSCPEGTTDGQCPSPGTFPPPQVVILPDATHVFIEFNLLP